MASRYWRCCSCFWIDGALDGVHMMPSRDCLIRQAILNAVHYHWPATCRIEGVPTALSLLSSGGSITMTFHDIINREFRRLTERNWEPLA